VSRSIVVLKFGGTSLGTSRRVHRAARRIREHLRQGVAPVVVVSATGRTTDRILARLSSPAAAGAAVPAREIDRALATGEDLAAALLAAALGRVGVAARSVRGSEAGIRVRGSFGAGTIERVDPGPLRAWLREGIVPVVSGFQGAGEGGETVTLGRGGSDTTAVALAAAVGAECCHIVTDVRSVFTGDPRADPAAAPLEALTHEELLRLSRGGARVVHPVAAALAAATGTRLHIYHHGARPGAEGGTRVGGRAAPLEVAV
jgi:aspartate kinase